MIKVQRVIAYIACTIAIVVALTIIVGVMAMELHSLQTDESEVMKITLAPVSVTHDPCIGAPVKESEAVFVFEQDTVRGNINTFGACEVRLSGIDYEVGGELQYTLQVLEQIPDDITFYIEENGQKTESTKAEITQKINKLIEST